MLHEIESSMSTGLIFELLSNFIPSWEIDVMSLLSYFVPHASIIGCLNFSNKSAVISYLLAKFDSWKL